MSAELGDQPYSTVAVAQGMDAPTLRESRGHLVQNLMATVPILETFGNCDEGIGCG